MIIISIGMAVRIKRDNANKVLSANNYELLLL